MGNNNLQENIRIESETEQLQRVSSQEIPTYRRVDNISAYVRELAAAGVKTITAEKFARIRARKGMPGEQVISWSVDACGAPVLEKKAEVTADAETGETGWVAVKTDEYGQVITDQNGNRNEWIIDAKTFHRKYEEDHTLPGIYRPVGGPQKFMKLFEAVTIQQEGSEMSVDAGGYVNVTDPDDIYVISARDFNDTYRIL